MKILRNFIVLGANCKFIDAFYVILAGIRENAIELKLAGITFATLCKSIYRFYYKSMIASGLPTTRRLKAES